MTTALLVLVGGALVQILELPFRTTASHATFRLAVVNAKGEPAGVHHVCLFAGQSFGFRCFCQWWSSAPLLKTAGGIASHLGSCGASPLDQRSGLRRYSS